MLIKYIGNKARKTDNVNYVFGRSWTPGSVLDVPDAEGEKLLKFPTIWAKAKAGGVGMDFGAGGITVASSPLIDKQIEIMRKAADEIASTMPAFVPTKFEPSLDPTRGPFNPVSEERMDAIVASFDAARAISAAPPLNETSAMGDYLDGFDVAQLEAMRSAEAAGKARATLDKHLGYAIKRKQ